MQLPIRLFFYTILAVMFLIPPRINVESVDSGSVREESIAPIAIQADMAGIQEDNSGRMSLVVLAWLIPLIAIPAVIYLAIRAGQEADEYYSNNLSPYGMKGGSREDTKEYHKSEDDMKHGKKKA
jgi:hypothetical protein